MTKRKPRRSNPLVTPRTPSSSPFFSIVGGGTFLNLMWDLDPADAVRHVEALLKRAKAGDVIIGRKLTAKENLWHRRRRHEDEQELYRLLTPGDGARWKGW